MLGDVLARIYPCSASEIEEYNRRFSHLSDYTDEITREIDRLHGEPWAPPLRIVYQAVERLGLPTSPPPERVAVRVCSCQADTPLGRGVAWVGAITCPYCRRSLLTGWPPPGVAFLHPDAYRDTLAAKQEEAYRDQNPVPRSEAAQELAGVLATLMNRAQERAKKLHSGGEA